MSRPEALDWSVDNCTIARAMATLGDKWTFIVLREIFNGVRRFDQMRVRTNIPRQVLANRLDKLVAEDVLRKVPYREEGARVRYEYRLTPKGVDLSPALVALMRWGDKHLAGGDVPTVLVHERCGTPLDQTFICWHCDATVEPAAIRSRPGRPVAS